MPTDMTDELTPYARGELFKPDEKQSRGLGYVKRLLAPPSHVELTYNSRSAKVFSPTTGENPTIIQLLEDHVPSLFGPKAVYTPAWALPTGDIQTIYQSYGPHTVKQDAYRFDRRYLLLPDGGNLALDFTPAQGFVSGTRAKAPIVIMISGFLGGTHDGHIRETVMELAKATYLGGPGYRVVVMNMRGCNTRLTSPGIEHAARTDDIRSAVLYLTSKYPGSQLFALGFELGAGYVTNYLGETGVSSSISAGFVVSNMWDNRSCHQELGSAPLESLSRVIHNHGLGQKHRKLIAQNSDVFSAMVHPPHTTFPVNSAGKPIPFAEELKSNINDILMDPFPTMTDITNRFIAPVSGFSQTKDFLVSTSSEPHIGDVRVPLLCLNAADDLLFKKKYFPYDLIKQSQHVVLAVTEKGGHAGWFTTDGVEGSEDVYTTGLRRWYTKPIVEFFEAIRMTDPRPLPAPIALRPDSHGMVRCADDPAVGFKECSEQEIMALPVSDKKMKTKPRPTNAMDVVVFFGWLFSIFSVAFEVFGTTKFIFKFLMELVVRVMKSAPKPRLPKTHSPKDQPLRQKQESQGVLSTIAEIGGSLKFVFEFLRGLVRIAWRSTPRAEAERQRERELHSKSQSIFVSMTEIPGTLNLVLDFLKGLIKMTARSTLRSSAEANQQQASSKQHNQTFASTAAEVVDATKFTFDFLKGLVELSVRSTPPAYASSRKVSEPLQITQRSQQTVYSTAAEIVDASQFTFHFVTGVFKLSFRSTPRSVAQAQWEKEHAPIVKEPPQGFLATVVEVVDAVKFVFEFLKAVIKLAWRSTPRSVAEKEAQMQNRYQLVEGQWQKVPSTTQGLVKQPQQSVWSVGVEVVDAVKFTFDFLKELLKMAIRSNPPPKSGVTQPSVYRQTVESTFTEVIDALGFTFNFLKGLLKMAIRSNSPPTSGNQQTVAPIVAEVVDALHFTFNFLKGLIKLAIRSNLPPSTLDAFSIVVEVTDTLGFAFRFVKGLLKMAIKSNPPPTTSITHQQTVYSTIAEVADVSVFTFDFLKGVFKLAWRSTPRSVAQAQWDRESSQGFGVIVGEVVDTLQFTFEFLRELIKMAIKSTPPSGQSPKQDTARQQQPTFTVTSTMMEVAKTSRLIDGKPVTLPGEDVFYVCKEIMAALARVREILMHIGRLYWMSLTRDQREDPRMARMQRARPVNH
ncbi:hypothetical protein FRB95_010191 [Tulasnella sp. JGI-2019a]|nr:hypothetical protein FRB93_006110 [Tulasnella sp. JGI-2019a]KAG9025420.1 hypothetical protein FRB95_010191 [Tulasnella sp. JGI-2019a]